MKTRDVTTLIGACASAVGASLLQFGSIPAAWWTGFILSTIGPVLMGQRAFQK